MKPVYQTIFTAPEGNCYPACLASLLELPLEGVPVYHGKDWWLKYREWLAQFGLTFLTIPFDFSERNRRHLLMPGYTILAVNSPGLPGELHAVVALDGEVIHDPNPRYSDHIYNAAEIVQYDVLMVLDPARLAKMQSAAI